jgi:fucose permease
VWILARFNWTLVMFACSAMIFACFLLSVIQSKGAAVFLLPLSGLCMSMIYPTLNSKRISCFPKA